MTWYRGPARRFVALQATAYRLAGHVRRCSATPDDPARPPHAIEDVHSIFSSRPLWLNPSNEHSSSRVSPASKARAKLRALVPATDDDTPHAACPATPHPSGRVPAGCRGLSCCAGCSPRTFWFARAAVAAASSRSSPTPAKRTACSSRSGFPPTPQPSHRRATHPRPSSPGRTPRSTRRSTRWPALTRTRPQAVICPGPSQA